MIRTVISNDNGNCSKNDNDKNNNNNLLFSQCCPPVSNHRSHQSAHLSKCNLEEDARAMKNCVLTILVSSRVIFKWVLNPHDAMFFAIAIGQSISLFLFLSYDLCH